MEYSHRKKFITTDSTQKKKKEPLAIDKRSVLLLIRLIDRWSHWHDHCDYSVCPPWCLSRLTGILRGARWDAARARVMPDSRRLFLDTVTFLIAAKIRGDEFGEEADRHHLGAQQHGG